MFVYVHGIYSYSMIISFSVRIVIVEVTDDHAYRLD